MKNLTQIVNSFNRRTSITTGVIVTDLEPIIRRYNGYNGLYPIFQVFPLKELISNFLLVYYDQDVIEIINNEIDRRLDQDQSNDYIDVFLRDIFLENLLNDIEDHLLEITRNKVDYAYFTLDKWINDTTVVLINNH